MDLSYMYSKVAFLLLLLIHSINVAFAQTSTITTGTWNDPTIWSSGVPGTGNITANVNNAVEINADITIGSAGTGVYNFFQSATDFPGGTNYNLTVGANGTLDIQGGTTYFGGTFTSSNGSSIRVRNGATLILTGAPTVSFVNGTTVLIDAGGTLIINGNMNNNIAGSGSFTVQGLVQINGNYTSNGNVDILGTGQFLTTGSITTTGASGEVFGSSNDCSSGPCSGQNLCLGGAANVVSANQFLCSGSSASGLTGDAVSGVTGYQWQSSITSSTSGFSDISGATSQNFSPSTPTQTTWYRRRTTTASCTGTSSPVVITLIPAGSWSGSTSSDWNVASNWCSGALPTIATDVTIPAGVPNQPIVSSATVALVRNLTINSGATLTINASRQISISGNVSTNGTLSANGSIEFVGTSSQTIGGAGFSSYAAVTINNTSGATPALTISSTGMNVNTLTLTSGIVNLGGANLTIGVSGASAGSLSHTVGWLYNGNLTRWLATGALTLGSATGHFPVGTSSDYRPAYFGNSNVSTAGTIRVNHTATSGSVAVSFNDGATPVQVRSNSFWTVATGNSLASGNNFSLRTEGTGFGTVGAVGDLRLTQSGSASFGTAGVNGGTTSNPQVNRTGIPTANLTNNFYWGSVNSSQTPLPITLLSFGASVKNDIVQINWVTASEINNDFFVVERTADAEQFVEIARILGKGNSSVTNRYSTIDYQPLLGRAYYRLKQVDYDGKSSYSKLVTIEYGGAKFPAISAYIENEVLKINVKGLENDSQVPLEVLGTNGRTVFSKVMNSEPNGTAIEGEIAISGLPSGVYIVRAAILPRYLIQRIIIIR